MAVRLKDIARDLGVSVVTVSKVLRGNKDIGEETRRRVLKRMKELNYQPNMLARGLASGKTYTVGLVVPDLTHPFFAEFAKSLSGVLRAGNRALILAQFKLLSSHEWQRPGRHPEYPHFDVQFQIEYMAHHEAHHIYQMFQRRTLLATPS